jgi:potassium/hydrogen antiporter
MTASVVITVCFLLLLAYAFDISSAKTKIPSIVLLLLLGWCVHWATDFLRIDIPNLDPILPALGTIGLLLIVLEGSLELELKKENLPLVKKAAIIAVVPMLTISFVLGYAFHYFGNVPFKNGIANAIPIAVISGAVAISSAKNFAHSLREFITYECSLSDIFGVLLFNFITLNDTIDAFTFGNFFLEIIEVLLISLAGTIGLAFLLGKITHRIKFAPIIILTILIYFLTKSLHLPALVFILLFGIFLGNLDELKFLPQIDKLRPEILNVEVKKFKELISEFTFLIRSLFFLLFGYSIKTSEVLNQKTMIWAVCIVAGIFTIRAIMFKIVKMPFRPLGYLSPRGLITILLFLSVPANQSCSLANKSLIVQIVVMTALVIMFGLMITSKKRTQSTS